jgi:hypothetical protein
LVFTVDTNCELIKNEKLARHHKNESHHPHQKKKEERKIMSGPVYTKLFSCPLYSFKRNWIFSRDEEEEVRVAEFAQISVERSINLH